MLDRPTDSGDPLQDVIRLLRLQQARPARLDAGGDWAVEFEAYPHAKFAVVLSGTCWISRLGTAESVELTAGDAYVLANGQPYRLGSSPSGPAVPGSRLFAEADDGIARAGDAGSIDVSIVGGSFTFSSRQSHILLDALQPLVVLPGANPDTSAAASTVRAAVQILGKEARQPGLGSDLVFERLADLLLIQALRTVAARGIDQGQTGWLAALADPEIGRALHSMHADPRRRWTVADLGAEVGLSRSAFAERFRRLVGQPPLGYLLQWRMASAAEALEHGDRTVSAVAGDWGYASDSAFSAAFKRVMGVSPAHYRTR